MERIMEKFNLPGGDVDQQIDTTAAVLGFSVFTLALFVSMVALMRLAQIGPDIGEAVVFEPRQYARYLEEPGVFVSHAAPAEGAARTCVLTPSVIAEGGGRLVLEAKEMTSPPVYRAHWAGGHTDRNGGDCGQSADLTLQLSQVRILARVAGGWGANHGSRLF
jgi:hypothetical protein